MHTDLSICHEIVYKYYAYEHEKKTKSTLKKEHLRMRSTQKSARTAISNEKCTPNVDLYWKLRMMCRKDREANERESE